MDRRTFLGATCGAVCVSTAGCLASEEAEPESALLWIELENHRPEEGCEFSVRIEDGEDVVFEEHTQLGPAESGDAATVFDEPVAEPSAYTVRVEAENHVATVDTAPLGSAEESCLGLLFYLGANTLHAEHRSYTECE